MRRTRSPSPQDRDRSHNRNRQQYKQYNSYEQGSERDRRKDDLSSAPHRAHKRLKKSSPDERELNPRKFSSSRAPIVGGGESTSVADIRNVQEYLHKLKPINPVVLGAIEIPRELHSHGEEKQNSEKKKIPLSLEEIIKKKEDEERELSMPVFISKKERKRATQEEKAQKVEEKKRRIEEMRRANQEYLSLSQQQQHQNQHQQHGRAEQQNEEKTLTQEQQIIMREREEIKQEYLGDKKPKKRNVRFNEKHKVSFDWDEADDTTGDTAFYTREANLLFGRGKLAGVDQEKRPVSLYEKLIAERQSALQAEEEAARRTSIQSRKKQSADLFFASSKSWREKTLAEMTDRDWRIMREDFEIVVRGTGYIPPPLRNWKEANLPEPIMKALEKANYVKPTSIQMQCIPIGIAGRDLIGLAETGSGKTAAFTIPLLMHIMKLPKMDQHNYQDGPYALVLAPTRELAQQIEDETRKFASFMGVRVVSVVGGIALEEQNNLLRDGCEIIIATPGRLVECLENSYIVLNQCSYFVLDEADRMVDFGFEVPLSKILDHMDNTTHLVSWRPENEVDEVQMKRYRQTTMFSATMPPFLERIANKYLKRRVVVTIGEVGKPVDRIEHIVEWTIREHDKRNKLDQILSEVEPPVIIFMSQKSLVDSLVRHLEKCGFNAIGLHSGRSQDMREIAIEGVKKGKYEILVATDVASRGLDIPNVTLVINYDAPKSISEYTHRVGRTARAGKTGTAISFIMPSDTHIMYDLKQLLQTMPHATMPQELINHEAAQHKPQASGKDKDEKQDSKPHRFK